jgi:hypothetical protein
MTDVVTIRNELGQTFVVSETEDGPVFTQVLTPDDYERAIQKYVDATAAERRYSDGGSCASYATSTNPIWAAEAQAFVAWRDAVWAHAYAELTRVEAGQRPQPSVEDFLAELPVIAWPA